MFGTIFDPVFDPIVDAVAGPWEDAVVNAANACDPLGRADVDNKLIGWL
jgi:hypothetical protein